MTKVLIGPAPLAELEAEFKRILLDCNFELVFPRVGRQMVEPELRTFAPGCRAALAGSEPFTRAVIENAPELRVIARVGVGYDAVDVAAATERGIVVTIAPGTNQDSVAEHTMMLILGCARTIMSQHNAIIAGQWPRNANVPVRGRTLGLIGLGRIGKAVALRGLAFKMRVIAHEPFPDASFVKQHGIELMPIDDVFREADYLSLHAPMLPQSRHLVNARTLALMKPTAYLINTARGGLVNEADLCQALKERRIAGAGLDVFEEEPPGTDNPLLKLDNVLFTAHTAGVDLRSLDDMATSAAQAIADLSRGKWPSEKVVNPEVRERFEWD
jgi:phosphoglycerate dehydrogenase-like enzyme